MIRIKRVLLIGDSIRMCYQEELQRELDGEYFVWGSEDNNRFAKYTLNELGRIFEGFSSNQSIAVPGISLTPTTQPGDNMIYPDIIHWNNGLWDSAIVYKEDGPFTPIPEYISYMGKILRELRKITHKIIFATTTPVNPKMTTQDNSIISEYNKSIVDYMTKENVVINDLHGLIKEDINKFISEDNIHLSQLGRTAAAKQIAYFVRNS